MIGKYILIMSAATSALMTTILAINYMGLGVCPVERIAHVTFCLYGLTVGCVAGCYFTRNK